MLKYKILLAFALGFVLATGVGIYKQNRVAGKANRQISSANTIISDLQVKQIELEDLKEQIQQERLNFQQSSQLLQDRISYLQNELSDRGHSASECSQSKKKNGVNIIPSDLQVTIGNNIYNCKSK